MSAAEASFVDILPQSTILVVEDSDFMTKLLSAMLRALGAGGVARARNAKDALKIIEHNPPSVAIIDWLIEPTSGVELLRMIRSRMRDRAQEVPVVMCTAYTDRERVVAMRDAGADEVLAKPLSPTTLYVKLARTLLQRRPFIRSAAFTGPDRRRRQMPISFVDRRAGTHPHAEVEI